MSSVSAPTLPGRRRTSRVYATLQAALAHDRTLAFLLALIAAAVAYEPRIKAGGFLADDWPLYAAFKFPQIDGHHSALGALQYSAGSRIGHMFYWLVSFSLFGNHTRLYTATTALLAVIMAFAVYLLLRELRFSVGPSLAMMILTVVAPSVETVRFWFTPGGVQICLSLFFVGLTLAMRAFAAPPDKRIRLHIASWSLYLASAVYGEMALPLIGVCVLVYLTRASVGASLRRWALDMIVVVVGEFAALSFVNSKPGFGKIPSSMWAEHARTIASQTLTIFASTVWPLSDDDRSLTLAGVAVVLTAGFVLWRRGSISLDSRHQLQRWGLAFLICLAAIVACYAVYVPAMVYYEPLDPGLATHINIVIAAPLAVGMFSVLMLARVVLVELLDGLGPYVGAIAMAIAVAWFAVIVIDGTKDVRSDAHIWALAVGKATHVLHVLTTDLPNPTRGATVYTFGEAGTVAPGLPIFFTSWEQNSAVKIAYNRPDLSSYPVVVNGMTPNCTSQGVTVSVGSVGINLPSPYSKSYFFDIPSGHYERIDDMAACTAALSTFHPGPYVDTSLEWSQ